MRSWFHSFAFTALASVVVVIGLISFLIWTSPREEKPALVLYCAAALREPMEEIIPLYHQLKGVNVDVHYGESQSVLTSLELSHQGDLFLPADESYIRDAEQKGLLSEVFPLVQMNATLVVSPRYDKTIERWEDLFREKTRLAVANPSAAAVSRLTHEHLGEAKWDRLRAHSVALGPVTDVANAVKLGAHVDAGIIWDSMVASPNFQMLKIVRLPELAGINATTKIGILKDSQHAAEALAFVRFAVDGCPAIWQKHGFTLCNSPTPPGAGSNDAKK